MKTNGEIPSLLFGLCVEIDYVTSLLVQKHLTETSKLEYAISYDEAKQYKQEVLMDEDHKLDHIKDLHSI